MSKAFDFIHSNAGGSISVGGETNQHPTTNPVPPRKAITSMNAPLNFQRAAEGDTEYRLRLHQNVGQLFAAAQMPAPAYGKAIALSELDAALSSMAIEDRLVIKGELAKAGLIDVKR